MVTQVKQIAEKEPFSYAQFWDIQEENTWALDCINDKMGEVWGEVKDDE